MLSPSGVRIVDPSIQPFSVASVTSLAQFRSIEQAQQRIGFNWGNLAEESIFYRFRFIFLLDNDCDIGIQTACLDICESDSPNWFSRGLGVEIFSWEAGDESCLVGMCRKP
jgi:hypothetical protein